MPHPFFFPATVLILFFDDFFYPMARPAKPRKPAAKGAKSTPELEITSDVQSDVQPTPQAKQVSMEIAQDTAIPPEATQNGASKPSTKAKPAKKAAAKKVVNKAENKADNKAESKAASSLQAEVLAEPTAQAVIPQKEYSQKEHSTKEAAPQKQHGGKQPQPAPKVAPKPDAKAEQKSIPAKTDAKVEVKADTKTEQKPEQKPAPPKPVNEPPMPLPEFLVKKHGIVNTANVFANLGTAQLYEHILFLREGTISAQGAVVIDTKPHQTLLSDHVTIVREPVNEEYIAWNDTHHEFEQTKFNSLKTRINAYLQGKNIYVQDCFVGSDARFRLPFRIITEHAAQSLAARNLFVEAQAHELKGFDPRMTILSVPNFKAVPELDGTEGEAFAIIDFSQRLAIIGGTKHIGEIKNIAFTVMSYAMPLRKVLPLHTAAMLGSGADSLLLLGAFGSGKTTLAMDVARQIIGDDAHAWGDEGIFNLENGAFARVGGITPEAQPLLSAMMGSFGSVIENAQVDAQTRVVTTSAATKAFAALPRPQISNEVALSPKNRGGHPKHVIILVNDALGVLPPVARLSHEQAVFFFLSGYHAILPSADSTTKEPEVRFTPCFSEAQMIEDPLVYASLFREKLRRNRTNTWLVNTGWQGGAATLGAANGSQRIKLEQSRAAVNAIVNGALQNVEYSIDETFGLQIPSVCQGIPTPVLNPRNAWQDRAKYEKAAQNLVKLFNEHFTRFKEKLGSEKFGVANLDASIADALNPAAQQALQQNAPQNQQSAKPQQQPSGKQQSPKGAPKQGSQNRNASAQEQSGNDVIINENAATFDDLSNDEASGEPIPSGLFADAPEFAPEFHPTLDSALDAAFEGDDDFISNDAGMQQNNPEDDSASEFQPNASSQNNPSQNNPSRNNPAPQRGWKGGGGNRFRGGRDGNNRGRRR
jgi:phosphoenolpyruvate carboxykinase (ATP)